MAKKKKSEKKEAKDGELKKEEKKRLEIIKNFTKSVVKKYPSLIKSVVLFGSTARGTWKKESDIDVFVIVDDTKHRITPAMRDKLEEDFEKIASKISKKLSVQQPYLLTEFWNMVRIGHPIVFNFIREGIPVFDKDIFVPIKRLLQMGEIKPSREAVEKYMERAPRRLKRVETAKLYMVAEDCYYAMLESAQAVLMFFGRHPPRPEEAPLELKRTLVKMGFIKPELVEWLEGVIKVRKDIEHKKRNEMKGEELDEWIKRAKKFVKEMQKVLVKIEILKRESIVEKSYAIMLETITTLLNAMNKPPKRKEDIPKLFEEHIVKPGLVSEKYLKVLNELDRIRKIAMEGKITDISKSDILMNREYVRKFIREAGKILKSLEKEK